MPRKTRGHSTFNKVTAATIRKLKRDEIRLAITLQVDQILQYHRQCERDQHTDVMELWEQVWQMRNLLLKIKDRLK